eukprot:TRINITY_DN2980_c0_g2_i1.p1 TRINITY_DN2980_c0_g2~~TRINITY_DN2980_c0_g2_i1.p1  ORF type:complete len:1207 (+),score=285.99 TRINITY_DN2980_c0_g2_i1:34-3654(+)
MAAVAQAPMEFQVDVPLVVDEVRTGLKSLELARQSMQAGDHVQAIEHFGAVLARKPGMPHALIARGLCFLSIGQDEDAQADFAELISRRGSAAGSRGVYVLIALCLQRRGDCVVAIRYLSRCCAQFPSYRPAFIARAELHLKVKDYEKARLDFHHVLNLAPEHLAAQRGLGDSFRGLGDLREAMKYYTATLSAVGFRISRLRAGDSDERDDASKLDDREDEVSVGGDLLPLSGEASGGSGASGCQHSEGLNDHSVVAVEDSALPDVDSGRDGMAMVGEPAPWDVERILEDDPERGPEELEAFAMEVLMRRALLLRIAGDLDGAGADLLEVLQQDPQNGLALFWYGKLLLEQHRHKEAPAFLQAAAQHSDELRAPALGLLGALQMTRPDPDCAGAAESLVSAVRLARHLRPLRPTQWICEAAAALTETPRDANRALALLDRALAALNDPAAVAGRASSLGPGAPSHAAGSGVAAVTAVTSARRRTNGHGPSPEELCSETSKAVSRRRRALAQGDDLEMALTCSTYLQLVAVQPRAQAAHVPPLLHALRGVALCDLGLLEDSLVDARKALESTPEDEATKYNLHMASGLLRARGGEHEASAVSFAKAVALRTVSMEARLHRAVALTHAAGAQSGHAATAQARKLLEEALLELNAAEQQAEIAGREVPSCARRLRAVCFCGLGRFNDAWEALQETDLGSQSFRIGRFSRSRSGVARGGNGGEVSDADVPEEDFGAKQRANIGALKAEVLLFLGQHEEAVEQCTSLINSGDSKTVWPVLLRGLCFGELGESEKAFQDCRQALAMEPDSIEVHRVCCELFLTHRCYNEALGALGMVAKMEGNNPGARVCYLGALAHLGLGQAATASKELSRMLRLHPNIPIAVHARDGAAGLQMALDGDFRHAHVRFHMLLHGTPPDPGGGALHGLRAVFLPYELVLYRGVCALYTGDAAAAMQDFEAAAALARRQEEESRRASGPSSPRAARRGPEVNTREGLECFECEMLYNMVICHLVQKEYRAAIQVCERMLAMDAALSRFGSRAQCLVWFLIGLCHLARGEATDDAVREAFMSSYSYDRVYVDDFLRRHERRGNEGAQSRGLCRVGGPSAALRPPGGPPPLSGRPGNRLEVASDFGATPPDAAVACLRRERGAFGARLPPRRVQVKDVVIFCRASAAWPYLSPPEASEPAAPACLARMELPEHDEVGFSALLPWSG